MDNFLELSEWIDKKGDEIFRSTISDDHLSAGIVLFTLEDFEAAYNKLKPSLLFSKKIMLSPYLFEVDLVEDQDMIQEIKDEINKRIEDHNKIVSGLDFSDPWVLYVYFLNDGMPVSYGVYNDKYEDLEGSEDTLEKIKADVLEIYNEDKINQIRLELREKAEKDLEAITTHLLEDEKFHKCTNQGLRMKYVSELLTTYPDFKDKIKAAGYFTTTLYVNDVYRMYRESLK